MSVKEKMFYDGEGKNLNQLFTGTAFITFEKIEQKNDIVEKWDKTSGRSKFKKFRGKTLKVTDAPEPTDINWENFKYNRSSKWRRR